MGYLFSNWLQEQLTNRGWSQADLMRKSGLTSGGVNHILNGRRAPSAESCLAIAKALGYPPEVIFREAGLLPSKINSIPEFEEINHILSQLPPDEQENILEYARLRARISEKRGKYALTDSDLAET